MNKRIYIITIFTLFAALTAMGKQRSSEEMRAAALYALTSHSLKHNVVSTYGNNISLLGTYGSLSFYGFENGGYAVVTDDDLLPPVLAIVPDEVLQLPQGAVRINSGVKHVVTATEVDNNMPLGLKWWLQTTSKAVDEVKKSGRKYTPTLPSTKKHPSHVDPVVTSRWGQTEPFYDLCPMRGGERTVTGCVATSMAQVLYTHRYPLHGTGGVVSLSVPLDDLNGEIYTLDFDQLTFDWDNMIDYYRDGYTPEQGEAVATLMYACGMAANMKFDVESVGGSGTLSLYAQQGLNKYFGFDDVKFVYRDALSDKRFMDIVYTELASHRPIIHGGQGQEGGHSFVLCGYNEDGLIYVNWGWNGKANGYYDIDLLNPLTHSFASDQDMVYHIKSVDYEEPAVLVTVTAPGTLASVLPASPDNGLKIVGPINSTDLKALRRLLGCDDRGVYTEAPRLNLDLSEAQIVAGGEPYLIESNKQYVTADNEIPYKAFYNCQSLRRMKLPANVTVIGNGAWGNCVSLWTVDDNNADGKQFVIDDDYIYTSDRSELIAALPVERLDIDSLSIPDGITTIRPFAFSGYQELKHIDMPASLISIGEGAFQNSTAITSIKLHCKELPTLGKDAFAGMSGGCTLYVWAGLKNTAMRKSQWKDFKNIVEYGTTITATSTTRNRFEDNPAFGYTITGDAIQGTPELVCDATSESPAGVYPIRCLRGTVVGDDVDFVDGKLVVVDNTPSTINAVEVDDDNTADAAKPSDAAVYTLDGVKIDNSNVKQRMPHGVYIKKGKKHVVK